MIEPEFSNLFDKMLKHLNKNIKNINGMDYYLVPTKTINELKRYFYSNKVQEETSDSADELEENDINVDYYRPFF